MGWRRRIPIPWMLLLTLAMNASSLETSSVVVASKATDPMVGLRGRGDGVSRMGAQTWEAPKAAIDGDTDSSASSARKLGDKAEGQLRKLTRLLPRKRNEGEGETRQEEGHCMGKGDTSSSLPRLRSGSKNQGVQPNGAAHRKGGAGRNRPGHGTSLQQCAVDDCRTYASYGLPGQLGRSIVCARHRYPGLIDVRNRRCMHPEGCPRRATYGVTPRTSKNSHSSQDKDDASDAQARSPWAFCSDHRRPNDPHLHRRTCHEPDCGRIPHFGDPGSSKGVWCSAHKKEGQVDVVNPRCSFVIGSGVQCEKRAIYGLIGGKALACREHREAGHFDLVHKRVSHYAAAGADGGDTATPKPQPRTPRRRQRMLLSPG